MAILGHGTNTVAEIPRPMGHAWAEPRQAAKMSVEAKLCPPKGFGLFAFVNIEGPQAFQQPTHAVSVVVKIGLCQ